MAQRAVSIVAAKEAALLHRRDKFFDEVGVEVGRIVRRRDLEAMSASFLQQALHVIRDLIG